MGHMAARVPLGQWHKVLACVEGAMKNAAENCDVISFGSGAVVRYATDRAVAQYTGSTTSFGWPPDEHEVTIVLEETDWAWVIQQLVTRGAADPTLDEAEVKQVLIDALGADPSVR